MPRYVESLPSSSYNEYEQASLSEMIPVGVSTLPPECIVQILPNKQILEQLPRNYRQVFTSDFFAGQTLFTVPLGQETKTLLTGIEHCRKIHQQLESPIWVHDLPYFYLAQKAPGITGFFYKRTFFAKKWADQHDESIGLLTHDDQFDETIGSNALIAENFRVSAQLATIVLDKGTTRGWLLNQWEGDAAMMQLVDEAFGKFPHESNLVTGFQLESMHRRLQNIHYQAPEYSSRATIHHIAQGAYGLYLEFMRQSSHVLDACESASVDRRKVEHSLARLSSYEGISSEDFTALQAYLFALAAQNSRAIDRINTSPFSEVKVIQADMNASRNTDCMLTTTDAGDSVSHTVPLLFDTYNAAEICLAESSKALSDYFLLLYISGLLPNTSRDEYLDMTYFSVTKEAIRSMI